MWWQGAAAAVLLLGAAAGNSSPPAPANPRNFIAFGSCSKPRLFQPWDTILSKRPEMFLWTGDAVYTNHRHPAGSVAALTEALAEQTANPGYRHFAANVPVDGKDYPHRTTAQGLFLDFLNVSQTDQRRRQAGVYWARRAYHGRLQVIALDTRSHRESYYLPSVGGVGWLPFAGLVAALGRCVTAVLGLGQGYTGDVLGETQWGWLERTLTEHEGLDGHQRPELTVVISSVQVTTTNPVFESWGHFPAARRRLLALLQTHRPTGLLLISGDAHIGEIAASAAGTRGTLEVTSSGLTHSCVSGPGGSSCEPMLQLFAAHRQQNGGATDYFTGENFGGIEIEWPARRFTVSVFDLEGTTVLSATRSFDDPTTVADTGLPSIFDHRGLRGVIIAAPVALACLGRFMPCRRRPGRMNAPPKRE